ncbi:MAG: hypothetical protein ABWY01_08015 [Pseudoxanthomonas sp.]
MLRSSLALLLVCASAHAMAQNGRDVPANPGACQETEIAARESADPAGNLHSRASATRSKYARPAASGTTVGGGSDDAMPRARNARWHSFLPGMFR